MGEAALKVVTAANYYNAGTVEFLVDRNRQFYFLEMNTRLQVEHPVTEMVTGIDLVKQQIRIAFGEELSLRQDEISMKGAAIECRIYAEDPANNFFPSPGKIRFLRTPAGPGVRDDSGVYQGWTVPIDYDPLISKLIAWAPSRNEAIDRMNRALQEYRVEGIQTNLRFFGEILNHPDFRAGNIDTGFIDRWLASRPPDAGPSETERDMAVLAAIIAQINETPSPPEKSAPVSSWKAAGRERGLQS